jgi:hypothetical protein
LLDKVPYLELDLKRGFVKENKHEIFPIFIQTCDLEDIYNIMNIEFSQPIFENCSDEVGMALVVEVISTEKFVHYSSSVTPSSMT